MLFFGPLALSLLFWEILLRQLGLGRLAERSAARRYRQIARRFRTLATDLGGIWIKVGQFLSARVDVLPGSLTEELAGLQDEVAAEDLRAIRSVAEAELGAPIAQRFAEFDPTPLAAASLGQVHRALLLSGERVVVKVQRPGIERIIAVDLAALRVVVGWFKRYQALARRANLDALVTEFGRVLWQEIDYQQEADHARRFAAMFAAQEGIRIPRVHDEVSTKRVLTLEDVYFIKVTDYAAIEASGVDRREVADRLFRTYLHQIFEEGFFHADPHPGNLFVEPLGDKGWRLVFVDFGMVGRLPAQAKEALREVAIAVGTRDADRVIRACQMLGILLPGADLERVRQVEVALFDRFWGKTMREMARMDLREAHEFMHQFRDLLYELPFQLPSDLVYLGRCVAILSGMCTGLNPDFNLFEGLAPFARQLIAEESRPWVEALLEVLAVQGRALVSLPTRLDSALDRIDRGTLTVTARAAPELERQVAGLTRAINRLVGAVVFLGLLLVGALLLISGETLFGGIGLVLALVALMWILVG